MYMSTNHENTSQHNGTFFMFLKDEKFDEMPTIIQLRNNSKVFQTIHVFYYQTKGH